MRRSVLSLVLLVVLALLVACSGKEAWDPTAVRVHLQGMPASTSLLGKFDRSGEILATLVTDSLIQFDAELKLHPRVAESWEISDDRRTITFVLRDGVRWHDGRPVTAADVLFSVATVRDPVNENATYLSLFEELESIEAIDERRVRATFATAHPDMLETWRLPLIPEHLAAGEPLVGGSFAARPVGCGPWRVRAIESDVAIELEANPDYWDGAPEIERLVLANYTDQRTAYQSLLRGDLDLLVLTPDLWTQVRRSGEAERFTAFSYDRLAAWAIAWNQGDDAVFFDDPRVRRAMVAALDRESFSREVAAGMARPGINSYSLLAEWRHPEIEAIRYDPERARQLLEEAGWIDSDGDGVRDRDGRPFRFEFLYPVGSQRLSDLMAEWQQEQWAAIGVEARLTKLDWIPFRERRNAGEFDAAAWGVGMTQSGDQGELYHSEASDAFNVYGLDDPEIDRLVELGRATFDLDERREVYYRLQERLAELEPLTIAFVFQAPVLHDPRLRGVRPAPVGLMRTIDGPQRWRWDPSGG